MEANNLWERIKHRARELSSLSGQIDTDDADQRIRGAIWFRGPNVWILAFSIIIASVGLNVNSTAVIIGAMLISPLMGPIIGAGLALGINDTRLLWDAARNLLVMVAISLVASTLFFLISPLDLVNPTELEARTSPSIYDVMIALFGGFAGIFENARKERGTVLSGVAIATALMPPLCTAGYGIANWSAHFFLGAMFLFIINAVFIILATYVTVKYMRFHTVSGLDEKTATRQRRIIGCVIILVLVPSIWTAVNLVMDNNFERNVGDFVKENRIVGHSYIYDYDIQGRNLTLKVAGEKLDEQQLKEFRDKAATFNIKPDKITIQERSFGLSQREMNELISKVYEDTEKEKEALEETLSTLRARLDSLETAVAALRDTSVVN